MWSAKAEEMLADGLSKERALDLSRWAIANHSIGMCARWVTLGLFEARDEFLKARLQQPPVVPKLWIDFEALGRRMSLTGARREGFELKSDQWMHGYCKTEIEAVSQMLAEM